MNHTHHLARSPARSVGGDSDSNHVALNRFPKMSHILVVQIGRAAATCRGVATNNPNTSCTSIDSAIVLAVLARAGGAEHLRGVGPSSSAALVQQKVLHFGPVVAVAVACATNTAAALMAFFFIPYRLGPAVSAIASTEKTCENFKTTTT